MTDRQSRALSCLIRSPTTREAAKAAGIGYSTLRAWLRNDMDFRKAYQDELAQLLGETGRCVRAGMGEAVETLRKIIGDPDAPSSARVAACRVLLESGLKVVEAEDIVKRLEALEDAQRD